MTETQKLQLRQSELRQKLAETLAAEEPDTEALEGLNKEMRAVEIKLQSALLVDGEVKEVRHDTAEGREIADLEKRASLADFVLETHGQAVQGASAEYRAAIMGDGVVGYAPLALFGLEQRADAVSNPSAIADNQQPIQGRVFNIPATEYLGVATPTVPVGTNSFPRLGGGTTADVRSPGVELDGAAATIVNEQITPVRLTSSYTYSVESLANVLGFEEALRSDVQAVLREKRDSLVINGAAAVANTSPAVEGIISGLTDPTDPVDTFVWSDVLAAYDEAVDGKHAADDSQVRLLVNAATYRAARQLQVMTSGQLLRDLLPSGRFRVSAAMPATSSDIATYIAYAAGSPTRGMISPTWAGIELISDRYTGAKSGQRLLTAIMTCGFQIADSQPYRRGEFKIA